MEDISKAADVTEKLPKQSEAEKSKNVAAPKKVLFVEPFYGGSHKQLMDLLMQNVTEYTFVHLTDKKWHWRARCSALILSSRIPKVTNEEVLFCSSVVNLAELLGLRPDLQKLKKVVYFHENQMVYPVQVIKKSDVQFQYNEIITCLAADVILFNSNFNKMSFLCNIHNVLKLLPDYRPQDVRNLIEHKCSVLYFPIQFPPITQKAKPNTLHIIWPHRWEFDKNPKEFFSALFTLKQKNYNFLVSILGQTYSETPAIFSQAKNILDDRIINYGYLESRQEYLDVLATGHIVVSTASHEFFGVAMLEATYLGCFPLVPDLLVYPEIYPRDCFFRCEEELVWKLGQVCENPILAFKWRQNLNIDFRKYSDMHLVPQYLNVFNN